METIEYRVNEVAQETHHRALTAREILAKAEIDPDLHFLEETHPTPVSFQDRPDHPIELVPHMRFKTLHQLIDYKVNDEPQKTKHRHLTASQILENAGIDPKTNYLTEVFPEHHSFEGEPHKSIEMHQHMRFISVSTKPTPVSHVNTKSFGEQLRDLGYEITEEGNRISFRFKIQTGKRTGEDITLGFLSNGDFVLNPPSGPHVRPRLLPMNSTPQPHPVGGVTDSPFGPEWQYWSRPVNHWSETRRNAADFMAHIHRLFETL